MILSGTLVTGGAANVKANSMNVFITLGKLLLQEVGDDSILI